MELVGLIERASVAELVVARGLIERRLGSSRREVVCTCCGEAKGREAFSPNLYKRNGLQSHCMDCRRGYARRVYRECHL